jgi:hypothetical protein
MHDDKRIRTGRTARAPKFDEANRAARNFIVLAQYLNDATNQVGEALACHVFNFAAPFAQREVRRESGY